jgi:MFS family permease
MALSAERSGWHELRATGLLGRFLVLCLGVLLHSIDTLVTATIAPAIVEDIGGVAYVNWMISLYQLGAIIAGTITALLAQRHGVRRLLTSAAITYGAGCAVGALAHNMGELLVGRIVQGLGGGMLLSLCYVGIQRWFPHHLWKRLFGINAVIWGSGSLLGPLIGSAFATFHAWREAFWLFTVLAAVLIGLVTVRVPARDPVQTLSTAESTAGTWPVATLLAIVCGTLTIAASGATGRPVLAIGGCMLGVGLLYLAARMDRRSANRLLPLALLRVDHPVGAGLLMLFAIAVATTGFWAYGPLVLKILFNVSPAFSGFALAGESIAWSVGTMAVAALPLSADKGLIRAGVAMAGAGAIGFAAAVPTGSLTGIVACALLQGLGFGISWPSIVHRIVHMADPSDQLRAATSPTTVLRIGYAVGTAATGIAANIAGLADGVSAAAAKAAGFWVFAAFVPIVALALAGAWRFTAADASATTNADPA